MEHILQFGVTIDEQKIIDIATERAAESLREGLWKSIITADYYGHEALTSNAEKIFAAAIEDLKPRIIELTASKLADSLGRSKKFKEKLIEKIGGAEDETD